jgi:hypothetical protein
VAGFAELTVALHPRGIECAASVCMEGGGRVVFSVTMIEIAAVLPLEILPP